MTNHDTAPRYKRVLLVDDSKFDNIVNSRLIEKSELTEKLDIFVSGPKALAHMQEIAEAGENSSLQVPELIFLDINMPLMSGFDFLETFQQLPDWMTKGTRIVMLSSSINPEDRERSMGSPFVADFISKPLTLEKLKTF